MTTLRDVAKQAGVSKSTASRALSKPELVLPETIIRVEEAATLLGYVGNFAARAVALGRTGLVTIVLPDLRNSYFGPIISGVQAAAQSCDLHCTISAAGPNPELDLHHLSRVAQQVDGLILVAPRGSDDLVRTVAQMKPSVLIERDVDGLDSVTSDAPAALAAVVEQLLQLGNTRFSYIGSVPDSWQERHRRAAIEKAVAGRATVNVFAPCRPTFRSGTEIAEQVIASGETVAVCYSSAATLGLLARFQQLGIAVPDDVALVCTNELESGELSTHEVTAVQIDGEAIGKTAMKCLLNRLEPHYSGGRAVRRRLPVKTQWADKYAAQVL